MSQTGTTNFGGKLSISTTAFNSDVELADCQGASYTQLPQVGSIGETGITQQATTYSTWDRPVLAKGKGEANAGDPEVEVLDVPSAGMTAFLAASAVTNQNNYIFKVEWADGTIEYNRGLVMGPRFPKGQNSEFKRAIFVLGLQQEPILDEVST